MPETQQYLREIVLYGGIPVRRFDMLLHLQHLGVTGPAQLVYDRLPVLDCEPEQHWSSTDAKWVDVD